MTRMTINDNGFDIVIYDNDHCPGGMRYLEDLSRERLFELLDGARLQRDHDVHFTALISGREAEFILIRRGDGEYELAPGNF